MLAGMGAALVGLDGEPGDGNRKDWVFASAVPWGGDIHTWSVHGA